MEEDKKLIVKENQKLLSFLKDTLKDQSGKKRKKLLESGAISVNGIETTKFNHLLIKGDVVVIGNRKRTTKKNLPFLILDETKDIIVVSKPSGRLTVSTEKETENTLFHQVSAYVKKQNPKNKIFVVHRLDKETSGIVLFAKNEKIKRLYQNNWNELVKVREYIAMIEGNLIPSKGMITSYLTEDKTHFVHSTKNKKEGRLAITEYETIDNKKDFSLIKINLKTGRKNQIRVHMKEANHPIVGDKKYSSTKDPIHRLALHASRLVIMNPITHQLQEWNSEIPKEFSKITKL